MPKLDREQIFAVGAFCLLMLVSASLVAGTLLHRAEALSNVADLRDQVAGLEVRARSAVKQQRNQIASAPEQAFLDAPTGGLAAAQLQAYLSKLVTEQRAVLVSSGVPPAALDDKSDAIKLQIVLNATLPALQALLYQIESGVPYVLVDALSMQPGGTGDRSAANPVLKVNLTLRAFWRRKTT
jgi:general secretion pathway protein M